MGLCRDCLEVWHCFLKNVPTHLKTNKIEENMLPDMNSSPEEPRMRMSVCVCMVHDMRKDNDWCLMCIVWARGLIVVHRRTIHHIIFIVLHVVSSPCHRQLCFISERPLRSALHKKLVKAEGREEEALKQQRAAPP